VPEPPAQALDLGSGGGVPGLVLAERWPTSRWTLLDRELRRVEFLEDAVTRLGWHDRIEALHARAEDAGRDERLRGSMDLVCARSFGKPAVAAECGAPFLRVGGRLIVSDPPGGAEDRWPAAGLAPLGLGVEPRPAAEPQLTVLVQRELCPERYPRRTGVPATRPLF